MPFLSGIVALANFTGEEGVNYSTGVVADFVAFVSLGGSTTA